MLLMFSSPRTRQIRTNNRAVKDGVSVDQSTVGTEPKDVSVQPLANPAEEREKRLPRIIRQYGNSVETSKTRLAAESRDTSALDEDEEEEIDSAEQVIVIGLDETGKQPSEEQLTAIIQVFRFSSAFREIPTFQHFPLLGGHDQTGETLGHCHKRRCSSSKASQTGGGAYRFTPGRKTSAPCTS
jgi:hypothetical protein